MTRITIGQTGADKPVTLDVERLIVSKLLITASSGGGKSWLLRKVLEGVSEKTQTIVIDTEGEFATLREKRDMVLAGPAGEVPAEVRSAGLLCRRLMELNLSAVIDISELKPSDKRLFVSKFCNTMVELPRNLWRPCFICLDETHEFAPEGEKSDSKESVALLGSKGRKRGYCILVATQRLAKLDKDVAAECKNQFIGQMNLDVDMKRAASILGFGKERWAGLRDLSPGQFFCFGPALNHQAVVTMRSGQVETTHPKAGQGRLAAPPAPSAKIQGVLGELTDLAKKADEEAKTLADAQREIRELRRQLAAKPAAASDQATIDRAVTAARRIMEAEYSKALAERDGIISRLTGRMGKAHAKAGELASLLAVNGEAVATPVPQKVFTEKVRESARPSQKPITRQVNENRPCDIQLGKAERAILTAFYWLRDETATPAKVGFYADYTAGSGSFNNALGRLRSAGLLAGWSLTEAGAAMAESLGAGPKPTGADLRDWLRRKLGKAENALLDAMIEAHPNRLTDEELGPASGYTAGSGSFNNALGRLRSIEAAEGYARDGGTKARAITDLTHHDSELRN